MTVGFAHYGRLLRRVAWHSRDMNCCCCCSAVSQARLRHGGLDLRLLLANGVAARAESRPARFGPCFASLSQQFAQRVLDAILGHAFIEKAVCDKYSRRSGLRMCNEQACVVSAPGYLAPQLPTEAPEAGEPFEAVMRDVDELIVPGARCHACLVSANEWHGMRRGAQRCDDSSVSGRNLAAACSGPAHSKPACQIHPFAETSCIDIAVISHFLSCLFSSSAVDAFCSAWPYALHKCSRLQTKQPCVHPRDHPAGMTHWQSPSFFAYFPANSSFPGLLGEMLSGAFNVIGFSWIGSPAATELETVCFNPNSKT